MRLIRKQRRRQVANLPTGLGGFLADAVDTAIPAIKAGVQGFNPAGIWDSAHNIGLGALSGVSPSQYGKHRDYIADLKIQQRTPGTGVYRDDYLRGSAQDLAQRSPLPSPVLNALGHAYQFGDEISKSFRNKAYPDYSLMDAIEEAGRSADINKEGIYNRDLPLEFPKRGFQFDLTPDLDIQYVPQPFSEGIELAPYQGPVDWDFTPDREDWFPERINYTVPNERPFGSDPSILSKDIPQANIEAFDPVMPVLNPFEPLTEQQTVFDSTTPGPIGDYLRAQEQEWILPSGPEEMTEVFTEEDKAAEDEQRRINEIAAQAERDRFELERKAERLAWEARREQERAEEDARKKREEAAKAQDRQDKARLAREADERERQAQERQRELEDERRQAVEAARLNALAAAAEQQRLANERRQREEQARKQAEFDRQHQRFMDQLIANNRNRGSYRGMQPGLAGPR